MIGGKRTILFYVHFNKFNRVEDYVIYQLQQMRPVFDTIIVLSNSLVTPEDEQRLLQNGDRFFQRMNHGFDFAAWRDGLEWVGWDETDTYDEVTIMNDTCFGPLFDFYQIYEQMQKRNVDFWGMTANIALDGLVLGEGRHARTVFAPEHLQSYYATFTKPVVSSKTFRDFWAGVKDYDDVFDVIINYEIVLTDALVKAGFTHTSYHDAVAFWNKRVMKMRELDTTAVGAGDLTKYNPGYTCVRPLWLLETSHGYPFIKTKAITMASDQVEDLRKWIINNTDYPISLIDNYICGRFSDLMKAKDDQVEEVRKSRTYRLGWFLAAPWRLFKDIFR